MRKEKHCSEHLQSSPVAVRQKGDVEFFSQRSFYVYLLPPVEAHVALTPLKHESNWHRDAR